MHFLLQEKKGLPATETGNEQALVPFPRKRRRTPYPPKGEAPGAGCFCAYLMAPFFWY